MKQFILITMYLGAIIPANLVVAKYGTMAVLPVAFLLIGFDLTARDYLHITWKRHLWLKMLTLILAGSVLSWLLNKDAGRIAIASFLAFLSSGLIDTVIFACLGKKSFMLRVNGSNVFSSLTDSVVFLTIAFGSFPLVLILAQFGVKFIGGFLWSIVLRKLNK